MTWHLAQLNIGRLRAPIFDPALADFVANLDPINALADATPGFVWRLQTEEGNATAIRPFADDELMAINMSVWESMEALADYVYRSGHTAFLRRRSGCPARPSPHVRSDTGSVHVPTAVPSPRRVHHRRRRAEHLPCLSAAR